MGEMGNVEESLKIEMGERAKRPDDSSIQS
jgi:hypothetical protein